MDRIKDMMRPLSLDENVYALDQLIAANRAELARVKWQLQLHRDVLNSPAETLSQLETAAQKTAQALDWLEDQRMKLFAPPIVKQSVSA